MSISVICHACAGGVTVRLRRGHLVEGGGPAGCCFHCQTFACTAHGSREASIQKFRCVECLPGFLLYSAVMHSQSQSELAKIILDRAAQPMMPWRVPDLEQFLAQHDLISEPGGETISEFYHRSAFDLGMPELKHRQWENTVRDLQRIQIRLDATAQQDLLKLVAAYVYFLHPRESGVSGYCLPTDLRVLRSALLIGQPLNCDESMASVLAS